MNKCNEQQEGRLKDYFLNRLSPQEVEAFQFHLLHCDACRKNLVRMRSLAAYPEEEQEAKRYSLTFGLFTRVAVAVGLVLLLAGGGYFFLHTPEEGIIHLEMNEPPVFHSGDSVRQETDSMQVDSIKGRVIYEE